MIHCQLTRCFPGDRSLSGQRLEALPTRVLKRLHEVACSVRIADPDLLERPASSWCACRSASPSYAASNAYRRRTDRGRRPPPSARRSWRTVEWRHAESRAVGSERGSLPTSGRPSRSRQRRPCASARSVRTGQVAAFSATRPSRVRAPAFHASRRAPAG